MCIQKHGRHGQLGCKHYTECACGGRLRHRAPTGLSTRWGCIKCLWFLGLGFPPERGPGAAASGQGAGEHCTADTPQPAAPATHWLHGPCRTRCGIVGPRAESRLKGCDEVSHREVAITGTTSPAPTFSLRVHGWQVPDLLCSHVWSTVPKEAHWVLAAPGLGAQFFVQYIH